MSCSITFAINNSGKLTTKVKWDKNNIKSIGRFRKFLSELQKGKYNFDICEAVLTFGKDTIDKKNARRILRMLAPSDDGRNEPILFPQELGKDISSDA